MGKLDGQVALISGASRGQGEAEARLFAREGAAVMLADVLDEDGERVANSINDTGGSASYTHLDVADESAWADAVSRTVSEFGKLTILLNNAGILMFKPIEQTTLEEYMRVVQINQVGVFLGMREAIGPMREAGGGCIINTSSTAGLQGNSGLNAYAASKFAVRGMTKVAAQELGQYGIRVNSVHPGPIDTPMIRDPRGGPPGGGLIRRIPIARAGEAEEVAKLMLFIAADATYSTGSEFVLDGGLTSGSGLGGDTEASPADQAREAARKLEFKPIRGTDGGLIKPRPKQPISRWRLSKAHPGLSPALAQRIIDEVRHEQGVLDADETVHLRKKFGKKAQKR